MKTKTIRVNLYQAFLHSLMMTWPYSQTLPPNTAGRLAQLLRHAIDKPNGGAMEVLKATEPIDLPAGFDAQLPPAPTKKRHRRHPNNAPRRRRHAKATSRKK